MSRWEAELTSSVDVQTEWTTVVPQRALRLFNSWRCCKNICWPASAFFATSFNICGIISVWCLYSEPVSSQWLIQVSAAVGVSAGKQQDVEFSLLQFRRGPWRIVEPRALEIITRKIVTPVTKQVRVFGEQSGLVIGRCGTRLATNCGVLSVSTCEHVLETDKMISPSCPSFCTRKPVLQFK